MPWAMVARMDVIWGARRGDRVLAVDVPKEDVAARDVPGATWWRSCWPRMYCAGWVPWRQPGPVASCDMDPGEVADELWRLRTHAAAALGRAQMGDAEGAAAHLRQVVHLDGSPVPMEEDEEWGGGFGWNFGGLALALALTLPPVALVLAVVAAALNL